MSNESTAIDALEEDSFESAIDFDKKVHPWRICPIGTHLVKEHPLHVPPSKKHPDGMLTTRHQHCANNPSKKDLLSFDEIQHMTETCFEKLVGAPAKDALTEFPNADKYDKQIRGWVRYWNEIFYPTEILNPNLVKALIATESSFNSTSDNKIKKIHARGLMQIRDQTLHILSDHKGELKDYLIHLDSQNLFDPSANICAGVRWLFQKKNLASVRLKRTASWEEAIIEYKGYWNEVEKGEDPKPMQRLREYYSRLQKEIE